MLRPQRLLKNRQRPPEERLGLGVLALLVVELRQVVEARGYLGVLRPQRLLKNRQRALVERLGLGVLALLVVEQRQVVEAGGQARILLSKLFRFFEGSQEQLFSPGVISLLVGFLGVSHYAVPARLLSGAACAPKS